MRSIQATPERFLDTSPIEAGFALIPTIGVLGPIVLGVVAISSEYTPNSGDAGGGRQIITTLTSIPRRVVLVAAKVLILAVLTAALAAVSIPTTIAVSQAVLGAHGLPLGEALTTLGVRLVGAGAYWMLAALIAFAVTVLTRSGAIPLIVLIANSSLVSFSLQVSRLTPLGRYLPDIAGAQMFTVDFPAPDMLDPVTGGVVMAAWTVGLVIVATVVLARRDA
jgi:hypothetical protein